MTRHITRSVFLCFALLLSFPAMAQDGATPEKKLMLVWPDPTPEELALLPEEGCKELDNIKPVNKDTTSAAYIAWRQTPDGVCYEWYKKRMDEAYVYGDTPPPSQSSYSQSLSEDARKAQAQRMELIEKIRKTNAERGHVPTVDRMKPAGSHPAPSPGNPTPSVQ